MLDIRIATVKVGSKPLVGGRLRTMGVAIKTIYATGGAAANRAILRVMETASKHLDAAQLLRKAQKLDASVDRSTVYRTLQLLKRHGLIDELDLMHIHGEGHYYERKLNRDHIHMACLRCGKIMEFVSDIFEKLKGQVEKDCRFRIVVSRLEIGGYCTACSK